MVAGRRCYLSPESGLLRLGGINHSCIISISPRMISILLLCRLREDAFADIPFGEGLGVGPSSERSPLKMPEYVCDFLYWQGSTVIQVETSTIPSN